LTDHARRAGDREHVYGSQQSAAIGVPLAIFCVRYVKSQLYEITSVSVPVITIAIVVLVSAAAIAGFIPALRAASIDPVRALRAE